MTTFPMLFPWLAPRENRQVINPWSFFQNARFSVFDIEGQTTRPEVERAVLDVASYGKQLGRIGDVLAVLMRRAEAEAALGPEEAEAFLMLRALLREIDQAKQAASRE